MTHCRLFVALLLALSVLSGCRYTRTVPADPVPAPVQPGANEPGNAGSPAPTPDPTRARMVAVGDLLMHLPLVTTSALPGGGFDFTPIFDHVRPWMEGADFASANLETTLAGPQWNWSGYPSFNTPPELARDLRQVGFDVVTHANNHTLDYGEEGMLNTIDALNRSGLVRTGAFRSAEEREEIATFSAAGITIAFFAYTYGTNGIPLPYPHSVNLLDPDRIREDIRRARATAGIDLVTVALHFGNEYERLPTQEQRDLVDLALEAGADIVLGAHPHVLQPAEVRRVRDEHGRDVPRAVIYSMGNFISNQVGMHREQGVMFFVDLIKDHQGARVESAWYMPTFLNPYWENGAIRYRAVVLEKAIVDYEAGLDERITAHEYVRMKEAYADALAHLSQSSGVGLWRAKWPASPAVPGAANRPCADCSAR